MLGGDTPLGPPIVAGLEKEGYIVITSVASTNAVTSLESIGNGYVRALVLDPAEVSIGRPYRRTYLYLQPIRPSIAFHCSHVP